MTSTTIVGGAGSPRFWTRTATARSTACSNSPLTESSGTPRLPRRRRTWIRDRTGWPSIGCAPPATASEYMLEGLREAPASEMRMSSSCEDPVVAARGVDGREGLRSSAKPLIFRSSAVFETPGAFGWQAPARRDRPRLRRSALRGHDTVRSAGAALATTAPTMRGLKGNPHESHGSQISGQPRNHCPDHEGIERLERGGILR